MIELAQLVKDLQQEFKSSKYSDFLHFFVTRDDFPQIMQELHGESMPDIVDLEIRGVEKFLQQIFPLSRIFTDKLPLPSRQRIYNPYIERISLKIDADIFYSDGNIKKVYRELTEVDLLEYNENEDRKQKIQELETKISDLNRDPKSRLDNLQKEVGQKQEKVEQLKLDIQSLEKEWKEGPGFFDLGNLKS